MNEKEIIDKAKIDFIRIVENEIETINRWLSRGMPDSKESTKQYYLNSIKEKQVILKWLNNE